MTDAAEKIASRYGIDLSYEHKEACPRCRRNGRDNSGNNLHVYGEGNGAFCWSCNFTIPSAAHREAMGWDDNEEEEVEISTRERITEEEHKQLKAYTGLDPKGYRGIRKETSVFFGCRYAYDEETGEPIKQYVPTTINGVLVGYKTRVFPKDFSNPVGVVGKDCDLVGEFRFKNHTRTCLIVGGETKLLNAYQMLKDDLESKGSRTEGYDTTAVVCSTLGESGAHKQVQARYEFFNQFQKIVICMDNDKAGEEAAEKIAKVLPRGKAFIMKMRYKDADDYVVDKEGNPVGKEREFIKDFWNAKPWTPSGIVSADTIYEEIVQRAKTQKLPFPPMLRKLNDKLAGGINYGYIVNILAGSGSGKSSLVNQCCAYWMLELGEKVGVASLEAEASEFGENLLSYQMGRKIAMISDPEERLAFVSSKEAEEVAKNLFVDENGAPRIYLLDDRGDYTNLQEKIEELIIACGVRIVIIDVISDVFSGMSIEQIDLWMAWEKRLVKQYNCILIQVAHTRKGGSNEKSASQGRALTEESIIGSGTQYRSAGINIALQRDKTAEDELERNTTTVHLLKSRATGVTGIACQLYYDGATHQLHDLDDWMAMNAPKGF